MHTNKTANKIVVDTDLPFAHVSAGAWPRWVNLLGPCGNVKSCKGVDLKHLVAS